MIFVSYSKLVSTEHTGLFATSLSVLMYAMCLDSVSETLRTRDGSTVNMAVTIALVINGIVWFLYATLIRDIYVLIPMLISLISAAINFNLYQWTQGKLENNHWLVLFLQNKFNVKGNKALKVIVNQIDDELKLTKK